MVMAEPINLNRARKAKARQDAKAQAAENRVKFGRTRGERAEADAERRRLARELEGHRRED
jgi:hypothetical protein